MPIHSPCHSVKFTILLLLLVTCYIVVNHTNEALADQKNTSNTILRVAGWDVYTDPVNNNKIIGYESYEKQYGVSIEFTPLSNLDDIIEAAESDDPYDVIIISNEGIHILELMDLVVPLDLNKIPNYQHLNPGLKNNKWIQQNNNVYAIPWAWGPTGLLYDADVIDEPVSWNILWDPEYKGKVTLWDDVSMIWITALSLGYNNVYNLTRQQLEDVKMKLFALNNQVHGYYSGGEQAIEYIHDGKAIVLNSWFDPSARLQREGFNFKMIIPEEGAVGMFDSYLISSKTNHNDIAHQYINHQIKPSTQQEMIHITGLAPAREEIIDHMHEHDPTSHLYQDSYFDEMLLWDTMPRKHLYDAVIKEVHDDLQNKINAIPRLELNSAEKIWLQNNPSVTFSGDPNWLPFEGFNKEGQYIGIVSEHLKLISDITGIEFITIPSVSWTQSTEKAKNGLIDVLSETDDSDLKSHLNFTTPYITNPIIIAMSSSEDYVENIESIKHKKIALIKDYGYASKIRRQYKNIDFVTVNDIQSGLIAVSTGEIDALLCTLTLCSYTIAELNLNNVRITGKTEFDTKLAFGIQKNLPELLSIFNKAIHKISPEQQQEIFNKWGKGNFIDKTDYSLVYKILLIAFTLIIAIFAWNIRLSREVKLRNAAEKELQHHQEHLEDLVDQRTVELTLARDEAELANASKSEFLSRMSHELRTPMNAILGFGQILEMNVNQNLSKDDLDNTNEILIAGHHLLGLINDVLDLSRVELGQLQIELVEFDIVNLVRESTTLIQSMADTSGINISLPQADHTIMVHADRMRTKQIILNLLSNAVKYNNQDGKIEIKFETLESKFILSVVDTGRGIERDMHSRVFEPFDRLNANTTAIEGAGIGLALCKEIIELMDGHIGFSSEADQGSTFWIELNLSTNENTVSNFKQVKHHKITTNDNFNILYVEDNQANISLVSTILKPEANITLIDANSAEQALELLSNNTFDLIMLDIHLPGEMDGFDILQSIRAKSTKENQPVIAISANATEYDIKKGLDAGFDEYIVKPIDINQFKATLNRFLVKSSPT